MRIAQTSLCCLVTLALTACGNEALVRSDIGNAGDNPWAGVEANVGDLTIATYYLPVRKIQVHLLFDAHGSPVASGDKVVYGLSGVMVPGKPVRVRLPTTTRYATTVKVTTDGTFLKSIDTDVTDDWPSTIKSIATDLSSLVTAAGSPTPAAAPATNHLVDTTDVKDLRAGEEINTLFDPLAEETRTPRCRLMS